jgi:hypothetical protein
LLYWNCTGRFYSYVCINNYNSFHLLFSYEWEWNMFALTNIDVEILKSLWWECYNLQKFVKRPTFPGYESTKSCHRIFISHLNFIFPAKEKMSETKISEKLKHKKYLAFFINLFLFHTIHTFPLDHNHNYENIFVCRLLMTRMSDQ